MKLTKNVLMLALMLTSLLLFATPKMQDKLILPEKIYAVPGIETNIYYANIFRTINPANYSFEFLCKKGNNDAKRWHFTPKKGEEGTYDVTLRVWDDDGVVAEAKSQLIVTPADAGKDKNLSIMIVGSSCISMFHAYPTHIYNLFKTPGNPKLTMIGENGPRDKDKKLGEIRHEGYGGWSYHTFITKGRVRGKSANMRESPFWNFKTQKLDFAEYFKKNTNGKAPDLVTVSLGGNDMFRAQDATMKEHVAGVKKNMITFFTALRKVAPDAKVAIVLIDYSATSQDAFGYNYGSTQTRWQFKKNYAAFIKMVQALVKEKPELKLELVLLNGAVDNENNGHIYRMNANARNKATKVLFQANALHPKPHGYQQGADAFYCWMKYMLHRDEQAAKAVKK